MQKSINYNRRQTTKRRDRKKIDAPPFDPISPPRTTNSDVRDIYRVVYQNPFNFRAARVSTRNEQDRYLSPQPLRKKYFSEIFSSTVYIFRPSLPTCPEGRFFFTKIPPFFPNISIKLSRSRNILSVTCYVPGIDVTLFHVPGTVHSFQVFLRVKKKKESRIEEARRIYDSSFHRWNRYRTLACRSIQCETRKRGQISIEYLQLIHRRSNLSKNIIIFVSPSLFHFFPFFPSFPGNTTIKNMELFLFFNNNNDLVVYKNYKRGEGIERRLERLNS